MAQPVGVELGHRGHARLGQPSIDAGACVPSFDEGEGDAAGLFTVCGTQGGDRALA
ncbi:MAG: hypothetical protein U0Q12_03040 [Vicinamibacterales bacterium]